MIRALIVDDEVLARKRILKLLEDHNDVKVVGECRNANDAIDSIEKKEPDLVFLDIQMPGMDGLSMLNKLHGNLPYIIFATAYNQYAVEAFNVHAVDYLLKPFDEKRFNDSLNQARSRMQVKQAEDFQLKMLNLFKSYQQEAADYIKIFNIKYRGREKHIAPDEIYYLEAAGNYVALHLEKEKHLYRITMNELEELLDPDYFVRVHRSYMINKIYLRNYRYISNNEFKFTLKNDVEIVSGRAYKESIGEFLEVYEAKN